MRKTVALWAPDIEPPVDWLVPAILYQDKIATFAPAPYLDDRDGRVSNRIRSTLGELYEPVSLSSTFATADDIEAELRARVPSWIAKARRIDPNGESYTARWAERAKGFSHRQQDVFQEITRISSMIEESLRQEALVAETLKQQQTHLRLEESRLASLKVVARPSIKAAKLARREELDPLVNRVHVLWQRRKELDRSSVEYSDVCRTLDELRAQIDATRRSEDHPGASAIRDLEERIQSIDSELKNTTTTLDELRRRTAQLSRRRKKQQSWIDTPWRHDDEFSAENLWSLPPELNTIAIGKIYGPVFDFLASSAGMWVATRHNETYAGTLIGPRYVIDDIMLIVASHVAEARDDCVLMIGEQRRRALSTPTDALAAAAAVTWLLPVPQTSDLSAVRLFREQHADELEVLRRHFETPLIAAKTIPDLQDAIRDIQDSCRNATKEITRALELDRRVGLAYIRGSVVSEVSQSFRDTAVAGFLGTIPVFQSVLGDGNLFRGAAAGLLVTGATLVPTTLFNTARAWSARRRVPSPLLYTYEALRASERWRA